MSISINELSQFWQIRRDNIAECPACGKDYERADFNDPGVCPECELEIDEAMAKAEKELEEAN